MKKLALAATVATVASMGNAITTNPSPIPSNKIQLYIAYDDIEIPCPGASGLTSGLVISGTPAAVNMSGDLCLDPSALGGAGIPLIGLQFALIGATTGAGTVFDNGTVTITGDFGSGWMYYGTITATTTAPINCEVNQTGHLGIAGGVRVNTTFGLQIPPAGITSPFPGSWPGAAAPSVGMNDAICVTDLFGQRAGLFIDSSVTISN